MTVQALLLLRGGVVVVLLLLLLIRLDSGRAFTPMLVLLREQA